MASNSRTVTGHARAAQHADPTVEPPAPARSTRRVIDPLVSTAWLAANGQAEDLVIVDIRPAEAYARAHVPGSINEPFLVPHCAWATARDGLLLELPDAGELVGSIGALGIERTTRVVIVTAPNPGEPPTYGLSSATRVALTLIRAGVKQVSILDGGFPQWQAAGLPTTDAVSRARPVACAGEPDESLFVSRQYVHERIGQAAIVDARDAHVYFGATTEAFAARAGHIPSARSLPAPWLFREDGTYADRATLEAMAKGVIAQPKQGEVIVYCGVGGYASAAWYVLHEVLGYERVRLYDGSAQDWVREHPLTAFCWE